jgi:hypothetical protein
MMLNLARAFDPRFLQAVTRVQRVEVVNAYGETTTTDTSTTIQAVVTSPAKVGMQRFEDLQSYADTILVTTQSPLNGPTVGGQPDQIIWRGQTYIVAVANDYAGFGFTRAVCKLTDPEGQNHG